MDLRLKNIYTSLEQGQLDGLIVSLASNISYLSRFHSRDSYLLVSRKENVYFTDSRYTEEAKKSLKNTAVLKKADGSVFKIIADACLNLRLRRVGFEERHLPFAEYNKIKEGLPKTTHLVPTHGLIEEFRQVKDDKEIEKIRKALSITESALKFIKGYLSPGKKEIEVAAELERYIRYKGASSAAFDIIVAAGPNSSFPHHLPSQRKLKNNEPVLIDLGVDYQGYKCDLTRVFFLGKISVLVAKVYNIVLEAQRLAIEAIKPAKRIAEIDAAARQYIAHKGYGGFFGHNLGHGVGLDIHEEPHISAREYSATRPGMVFTVEPAVYLPNKFGIRIEDMVLVTKKGCKVLSGAINK